MPTDERFARAIAAFDAYNSNDPNRSESGGKEIAKEVLYATRMTDRLDRFFANAPEHVRLAVRCQHIGRWEIPRTQYPIGQKGYLQWRNTLKSHHAKIAEGILLECGYETDTIEKVKFLLQKKQLHQNAETQLLEDVICLVFVEFYLEDFATKHEDDKVVDILRKTMKKMTERAAKEAMEIPLSGRARALMDRAGKQ